MFGLVVLSDIHVTETHNPILDKIESLKKVIINDTEEVDTVFVLILGDSAFSGKEDEYLYAIELFEKVFETFKSSNKTFYPLIIPGNHDCNFESSQVLRNIALENIKSTDAKNLNLELINEVNSVQSNFQIFKDYFNEYIEKQKLYSHPLLEKYSFDVEGYTVNFNLLNSAWISERHEQAGRMYYPINNLLNEIPKDSSELTFSMIHHHLRWFEPNNAREVGTFLKNESDIILSGHEHTEDTYEKVSRDNSVFFLESGVLQDNSDDANSVFQILKFDMVNNRYKQNLYSWTDDLNIYTSLEEYEWNNIKNILANDISTELKIKAEYLEYLSDPEAPFQHPRKSNLYLDDIFVTPEVKEMLIESKAKKLPNYIDLREIMNDFSQTHIIFCGGENSGKTAMLKQLYKNYFKNNFYPILLRGNDFKKTNSDHIDKTLQKAIKEQYTGESLIDQFKHFDFSNKAILVDDWQNCNLNSKGKKEILKFLTNSFGRVVINTSDINGLRDLLTGTTEAKDKDQELSTNKAESTRFKKYEIQPLGYSKRAELVEKWELLGKEETITEEILIKNTDSITNQVKSILGKGNVPSFPLFIVTIMQALEAGKSNELRGSNNGYYYDILIGEALRKIQVDNANIDKLYNYVSHVSYEIFNKKDSRYLTEFEFKQVHKKFCEEYVEVDFVDYRDKLLKSSLMKKEMDSYSFKYPYVYYYFVAKYFTNEIEEEYIKNHIRDLCNNLYNEESANILMFLTHLSKNKFILQQVLEEAKNVFSNVEEVELEKDIDALNKLIKDMPKITINSSKGAKENRIELNKTKDKKEREQEATDKNDPQEFDDLETINHINQGFKTIELVGQIIKNYPGYIKKDTKEELSYEAIKTGLRLLNSFLELFVKENDFVIQEMSEFLQTKGIRSNNEAESQARSFLFSFCSWVTFSVIKLISKSLGNRSLEENIDNLVHKSPNVANRLIGISIKLDHTYKIPKEEVTKLYGDLANNILARNILRRMIAQHLHLFEVPFAEKQKICDAVGIEYHQYRNQEIAKKIKTFK